MRKICIIIFIFTFAITKSFGFAIDESRKNHFIEKRAVNARNLTDPNGCLQNCSVTSSLPQNFQNTDPITINCFLQKQRKSCYENCPPSDARTIILDNIRPLGALCNVPVDVLTEDSACVRNQSLDILKACDAKCPSIPTEQISPAVVVDPFFTHAIVVHFESDRNLVEKTLIQLCNFGTCQWSCKRPIFEKTCGLGTADRIEIGYNLAFQTIPKLYVDLKVIDQVPEECQKYSNDRKVPTIQSQSQSQQQQQQLGQSIQQPISNRFSQSNIQPIQPISNRNAGDNILNKSILNAPAIN